MRRTLRKVLRLLEDRTGLVYTDNQAKWVQRFLKSRMESLGMKEPGEYYALLSSDEQEWQRFLSAITVKEGYFFRHGRQFEWIGEEILPEMADKAAKENRPLLLWSAATAKGEEAYTLAILAIVSGVAARTEVRVVGSDIDRSALEEARRGVYTLYRLRGLPPDYVQRFFTPLSDNRYRVNKQVRDMVDFVEVNLAKPPYFEAPVKFDLILARNVFIYMGQRTIENALREMASLLREDGYLFTGAAESVWPLASKFRSIRHRGTIAFRLPGHSPESRGVQAEPPQEDVVSPMPRYAWAVDLLDLDDVESEPESSYRPSALESVLEEGDMLALAQQVLAEGKLKDAEVWASLALKRNALSAKAYFVLGMVYSREGMIEEAIDTLRKALYLEPTMASAYFELGNLYLRRGDVKWARVAFQNAARFANKTSNAVMLPGFSPRLLKWAAERAIKRLDTPV